MMKRIEERLRSEVVHTGNSCYWPHSRLVEFQLTTHREALEAVPTCTSFVIQDAFEGVSPGGTRLGELEVAVHLLNVTQADGYETNGNLVASFTALAINFMVNPR